MSVFSNSTAKFVSLKKLLKLWLQKCYIWRKRDGCIASGFRTDKQKKSIIVQPYFEVGSVIF